MFIHIFLNSNFGTEMQHISSVALSVELKEILDYIYKCLFSVAPHRGTTLDIIVSVALSVSS